jgi:Leucine-rich repeat (LRR) protein
VSLPPDLLRRAAAVAHARTTSFVALAGLAGLDPGRSFRGADLQRVDFGEDDLSDYNFTNADLRGADLSRARGVANLIMIGARLEGAKLPRPADFDLDLVHRNILAGRAPKAEWVPFIHALSFAGESLSDLAPLAGLAQLQTLWLDQTKVADLAPLAGLAQLQELTLNQTQVADLAPLAGLAQLQTLRLDGTQVADLAPLAGLAKLQTLWLDATQVADLAPLAGLAQLQTLWLAETQVADLAPLAGLRDLTVHIDGRAIKPADLPRDGLKLNPASGRKPTRPSALPSRRPRQRG